MGDVSVPEGYLKDGKGRLVPQNLVKPQEILEDQTVSKLLGFADDLSGQIARFRAHCFEDVGTFIDILAESYGAKKGGVKGNMTLSSYDGTAKVQVSVADSLTFGPELQIAKSLIDECVLEWSKGSNDQIKALVQHAFRVDKEGQVSREAIFALRKLEIDDDRWRSAIAAINDSITINGSKTYIRFYRRKGPDEPWSPITIDLAAA